jgi:hypothetical protein
MANLYVKTSVFFGKPSTSTNAQIAAQAHVSFSGRNQQVDLGYWSALIANGMDRERVGFYGKFDNGDDPEAVFRPGTSTTNVPRRNSIAFEEIGDMQDVADNVLAADSEDWVLRFLNSNPSHNPPYLAGDPVFSQSANVNPYIHMDTAIASYRDHFLERFLLYWEALDPADRPGFIWLDNGRTEPYFTGTSMIQTEQYPEADGSGWWTAAKAWTAWLIDNLCIPYNVGLAINLQSAGSSLVRFTEMMDVLAKLPQNGLDARVFIEFFALTSAGNKETTLNLWKKSYLKMKIAEGRGVACDCCVQIQGSVMDANSDAVEMDKAALAFATWLLGMGSQSTLRYSKDNVSPGYGYFSRPPIFNTYASIRQPIGAAYENGSAAIIRRDFVDGGYVEVDYTTPAAPTWEISPGVGSSKKPLVTQAEPPVGWTAGIDDTFRIFAEAQDGGALTYSLQSGTLPAGKTLNASTGYITGDPDSSGSGTATIRVSEAGGGTVDTTFTWSVAPGDPVPTPGMIIGINYGEALPALTLVNGDVFEAANAAILTADTGNGFSSTINGATDTENLATLTLDASVPDHWTTAMFVRGLNDATNPGAVITKTGITADKVTVRVGINTGGTPAGRIVEMLFNGVAHATLINFESPLGVAGALNTCYVIEYPDIDTSSGSLSIQARRHATATVSSRIHVAQVIGNQPPVWDAIGNKSITIGGSDLVVDLAATDPEDNPITLSFVSATPAFPGDWDAVIDDNTDGTGTLTITPGASGLSSYTVTVRASDGDLTADEDFVLNVFSLPTIAPIADFEVKAGAIANKTLVVTSPSATPAFTMVLTVAGQVQGWVDRFVRISTEDGFTYSLNFNPQVDQQGVHTVTVVWTDENGNQATEEFVVTVTGLIAITDVQRNSTGNSVAGAITIYTNEFTRLNVYVDDNRQLTGLTIAGDDLELFTGAQLLGGITPSIAGTITLAPATADVGVYNAVITVTNEDTDTDTYALEVTVEEEPNPPDEEVRNNKRFTLLDVKINKPRRSRRR